MSSATNAFEDLGYFCVDNLPITMLRTFARLVAPDEDEKGIRRAALVIDIREGTFLADFRKQLRALRDTGLQVFVIFLEASDEVLQHRFSETRRPHPADKTQGLLAAIRTERAAMSPIRALADQIIDTQGLKQISDSGELEKLIEGVIAANAKSVEEFKAGKEKAFNALIGQVMKVARGKANPGQVNEILKKKLME